MSSDRIRLRVRSPWGWKQAWCKPEYLEHNVRILMAVGVMVRVDDEYEGL